LSALIMVELSSVIAIAQGRFGMALFLLVTCILLA
jgi:hypothetical protein